MKLASALVIVVLAFFSTAGSASADEASTLTVSGLGSVSRSPDLAVVDLAIVTNDDGSAAKATSANNGAYGRLRDRLHALGLRDDALRTTSFSAQYHPRPSPAPNGPVYPPERYGYVVTRAIAVNAPRVDAAGAVVDAAVALGATINGIRYTLVDPRASTSAALAAAVADAQVQAKAVVEAAHMRIVSIKSIAVQGSAPPVAFRAALAAPAAAIPTELQPSPLEVRATVNVTYTIAP